MEPHRAVIVITEKSLSRAAKLKTDSNLAVCMGNTIFWCTDIPRNALGLIACHSYADAITRTWRYSVEDYLDVLDVKPTPEDVSLVTRYMHQLACTVGLMHSLVAECRNKHCDKSLESYLTIHSVHEEIHGYCQDTVVDAILALDELPSSIKGLDLGQKLCSTLELAPFTLELTSDEAIGFGAFSTVYEQGPLAIKKVRLYDEESEEPLYESSLREIAALFMSDDIGILQLEGVGMTDDSTLIAFDLAIGSMYNRFAPTEIKPDWILSLLRATEALHYHDILHTDIKPENLLLMPDGNIVLTDLNSVIFYARHTSIDVVGGTPEYTDYRLLKYRDALHQSITTNIRAIKPKEMCYPGIDIWSIGVTVLSLVSGRYPYFRPGASTLEESISEEVNNGFAEVQMSDDIRRLVSGMTRLDIDERLTIEHARNCLQ